MRVPTSISIAPKSHLNWREWIFIAFWVLGLSSLNSTAAQNVAEQQVDVALDVDGTIPEHFLNIEKLQSLKIRQAYWVSVTFENVETGNYVLKGGNWYMRNINFYDAGKNYLGTGNNIEISIDRATNYFYLYYPFIDEKDKEIFSITLLPERLFFDLREQKNNEQISFQSILLFLFCVSMFFAVNSKDMVYLYYGLYALSISVFFGYQFGLLGGILPVVDRIEPMWFWFLAASITLFYALFTIYFLDLKAADKKAHLVMQIGIGYIFFLVALSIILYLLHVDVQHNIWYKMSTIGIEIVFISLALKRIFWFPGILKYYYIVGVSVLLIISIGAQMVSIVQEVQNFNKFAQAGIITEMFILSLGLSARVSNMQKKKNEAQDNLIQQMKLNDTLQREYAEQLEAKVEVRTQALQSRNQENELLLREIHHRVKNNLQMITSLLSMQERRETSEGAKAHLITTSNKIRSIALIHEHLYVTEHFSHVNLKQYVQDLVSSLIQTFFSPKKIDVNMSMKDINVNLDVAMPIGLILNELITNSLKYAYLDHSHPRLYIHIKETANHFILEVQDNGPGPEPMHLEKSKGLGYTIIEAILENGEGAMTKQQTKVGYKVSLQMSFYSSRTSFRQES